MQRKILKRVTSFRDAGCGLLTILLVTLPLWVITLALRGPVFALGALAVLVLVVFAMGWLNRVLGERRD